LLLVIEIAAIPVRANRIQRDYMIKSKRTPLDSMDEI